jgi:hypothetical protein
MRTIFSLILAVWCLASTAFAEATTPLSRDPEAAQKLFGLSEASLGEYAQVEGTWELAQDTNEARKWRRVKTHHANKTTVTVYDAEGKIASQHNSEFKLKRSGMARVFVYSKVVPAMGPSKGHEFPGPFFYAYNVQDNRFIEAYGLLEGDDRSPRVLIWNRVTK